MLTHRRRTIALVLSPLLLIALIAIPLLMRQSDDRNRRDDAAQAAIAWLRAQQVPDGAFAGFSGGSDPGTTADVALAFAAAGVAPASVNSSDGNSIVDYLSTSAPDAVADAGLAAKMALAIDAGTGDPRDLGGVDLIDAIESGFDETTGWYGFSYYGHALAMLALHSQDASIEPRAIGAMLDAQTPEGSWGFAGSPEAGSGDSNTTAIVIQALVTVGESGEAVERGLDYLRSLQDENGAIAYDSSAAPDLEGDANSTALAIQAFVAAGEDPTELPEGDLVEALMSFQNESGAFQFQPTFPDDSLLATAQAIPALMLAALPFDRATIASPVLAAALAVSGTAR